MIGNVLQLPYAKDKYDKGELRKKEQEKLFWYYSGDKHNILRCLDQTLSITYDLADDVTEMQKQWVNITERIIDQLAVVYRDPAKRTLIKNSKVDKEKTELYNSVLPSDLNTEDKYAHRLAKLQNTIFTQVIPDKRTKKIKYKTMPSHLIDVVYDDEGNLIEFSYQKYFRVNNQDQWYKVVWTNEENFAYDGYGNPVNIPGRKDKTNPFGVIPFAKLQMKKCIDDWGEGASDVVNVNEQLNFLLTKLVNSDIVLGTEGTLLGINLQLDTKGKDDSGLKKIKVGRRHPIIVNTKGQLTQGEAQPSLQHVSFDPHIAETMDFIDWYIKYIASLKGLNPSAILSLVKDTSDYQKLMDAVDQLEIRRDDIEPLRTYEKERFEITRKVVNAYTKIEGFEFQEIPEDLELQVDFADVKIQETSTDKWLRREKEFNNNMSSPVDWMIEENPDLKPEDAKKKLEENRTINTTIGVAKQKSLVETLFNNNNGDQNAGQ